MSVCPTLRRFRPRCLPIGWPSWSQWGHNLDSLVQRAQQPGFRAVPLGITVSFDLALRPPAFESRNVVAKAEGADPRLRDEYVVFSAH